MKEEQGELRHLASPFAQDDGFKEAPPHTFLRRTCFSFVSKLCRIEQEQRGKYNIAVTVFKRVRTSNMSTEALDWDCLRLSSFCSSTGV